MSITVELPAEVERKLRAVANDQEAAKDVLFEESVSVTSLIREAVQHPPVLPQLERLTREELEASHERLTSIMKDRHVPYTGTFTREELYDDHL